MTQLTPVTPVEEDVLESTPRRRRGRAMSDEQIDRAFPSLRVLAQPDRRAAASAWVAVFTGRPDAMHALLADHIKQAYAKPGRIGQRPMPREDQVDFDNLLYGEFSDDPISQCLPRLMAGVGVQGMGVRTFAARANMSRSQLQRILRGDYDPDVAELKMIAAAVGKAPTYFVEYRKAMVMAAVLNLINDRPGIATQLCRSYLEVRLGQAS